MDAGSRIVVATGVRAALLFRCLCAAPLLVLLACGSPGAFASEAASSPLIGLPVLTASDAADKAATPLFREPGELVVFNRSIITFRSPLLGVSPVDRARRTRANLDRLLDRAGKGKLEVRAESLGNFVMLDGALALIVTAGDVDAMAGETLEQATHDAVDRLSLVLEETRESRDLSALLRGTLKASAATGVFIAGLLLLARARRAIRSFLTNMVERRSDRLRLAGAELLRHDHIAGGIRLTTLAAHWLAGLVLTYEWLSYSLSAFPFTRPWGEQLQGYMWSVFLQVGAGILQAVPNLAIAVLIFLVARAVVAMLRPVFDNIEMGRGSAGWLDRDTVAPTRRIASALIWIFALVMAYPYLPGAQTEAFKGVSVLIGLMISLGSSSIVGQGASGLILMYSRSLRRGEFVRIGDHEGTVTEVGLFMTKIRTGLGEEVNLPNALILGTPTKNYSRTVKGVGYIVDTTVSIGYDTPWRQVEAMLLESARRTHGILSDPAPQVFQTALADFYPVYRLVCQAVPEVPRLRAEVLNALHANVQDVFNENGVQIMSPHYMTDPSEQKIVSPGPWFPAGPRSVDDR